MTTGHDSREDYAAKARRTLDRFSPPDLESQRLRLEWELSDDDDERERIVEQLGRRAQKRLMASAPYFYEDDGAP